MNLFELLLHLGVFVAVGVGAAYLAVLPSFIPAIVKRDQGSDDCESEEVGTH
jgi:hypothetical protein